MYVDIILADIFFLLWKIRLENKGGRHSSIVLCTNGILLRVLISEGLGKLTMEASEKSRKNVVSDLTHIIVVCILFLASGFCHFLLALCVVLLHNL